MDIPLTENSPTYNEIRNAAFLAYLNRDAVRDELASIDCYLRSHEQCVITQSSPVYHIARIMVAFSSQSILDASTDIPLSIYSFSTLNVLANQYIAAECFALQHPNCRIKLNGIRLTWDDDLVDDSSSLSDSVKSINHRHSVFHAICRGWRSFILFLSRIARRFHLLSDCHQEISK